LPRNFQIDNLWREASFADVVVDQRPRQQRTGYLLNFETLHSARGESAIETNGFIVSLNMGGPASAD
jgi:hypothetical protein